MFWLRQCSYFGHLEVVKQAVNLLNVRFNQLKVEHPEPGNYFVPHANGLELFDFYSDKLHGVSYLLQ